MELAVAIGLLQLAYAVYVSVKMPSDFASQVAVNRPKTEAAQASAPKAAAVAKPAPANKAPQARTEKAAAPAKTVVATPVAKAEPAAATQPKPTPAAPPPAPKAPAPVVPVAKAEPAAAPEIKPAPVAPAAPAPAAPAAPVSAAPAPAAVQATPAPSAAQAPEVRVPITLKNPATGETAPFPADYRFAKKWIKDALVSEGLLDRVYKNNEMDRKISTRIRDAMDRLKAMSKYSV